MTRLMGLGDSMGGRIQKLRFDDRFRPAMSQVFSRAIMCPDLTIGGQYSRSHNLTAITLTGDKVDRKGAMTGGYHDTRRSRLESIKNLKIWQVKADSDGVRQKEIKREMNQLDQEITRLLGEEQVIERRLQQARESRDPLQNESTTLSKEIDQAKNRLERLTLQKTEMESEIAGLRLQIEGFQEEMKTPMRDSLNDQEVENLNQLALEIQAKKKELTILTKDKAGVRFLLFTCLYAADNVLT